jgi:hypothetical protein
MIFGDVQRGEVVEVVLDLRTGADFETGPPEQRLDPLQHPRDRMQSADTGAAPGQRDVDALCLREASRAAPRAFERAARLAAPAAAWLR